MIMGEDLTLLLLFPSQEGRADPSLLSFSVERSHERSLTLSLCLAPSRLPFLSFISLRGPPMLSFEFIPLP